MDDNLINNRYFIISYPKSGTYILKNLFDEFGLNFEGHYWSTKNFSDSVKLIKDGDFGIGHIFHLPQFTQPLQDFKKVMVIRNLADIKESARRWKNKTGYNAFRIVRQIPKITPWLNEPDVFLINYTELKGMNVDKIDQLQNHLFGKIIVDSRTAIELALQRDSFSKVVS